ncbi:hypothetical protein Ddc_02195 [Ditylenchus destructor]|nr:hypothetical protein Ddc_02195 [Ditylenchus destructor]
MWAGKGPKSHATARERQGVGDSPLYFLCQPTSLVFKGQSNVLLLEVWLTLGRGFPCCGTNWLPCPQFVLECIKGKASPQITCDLAKEFLIYFRAWMVELFGKDDY